MSIEVNLEEFHGRNVVDFKSKKDWKGPHHAYRLRTDWDAKKGAILKLIDELANCPDANHLKAIVIGVWGNESDVSSKEVVGKLVSLASRFPGVTGIFLGDITFEENEMSWIQQSNVSPILEAYSQLEEFRVRGGNGLGFEKVKHDSLEILAIETGGLGRSVIREVTRCEFPNLQTLELWLGTSEYGWDGTPEDLQPMLSGKYYPKLTTLGICNCAGIDELVPVIVNSPMMKQLTELNLSKGDMTDVGARSLLELSKYPNIKILDLTHHFITEDLVEQLTKSLKCRVIADDAGDPEEEWRSIYVSE